MSHNTLSDAERSTLLRLAVANVADLAHVSAETAAGVLDLAARLGRVGLTGDDQTVSLQCYGWPVVQASRSALARASRSVF